LPGTPHTSNLLSSILIANRVKQLLSNNHATSFSKNIFWLYQQTPPAPFCMQNIFSAIEATHSLKTPLLARCVFLKTKTTTQLLHTIDTLLDSPAVAALIADVPTIPFAHERRFAIRAKKRNIFTLFLRSTASLKRSSAAHSRWSLTPCVTTEDFPTFTLSLETKKGAQPARRQWLISFNDRDDTFCMNSAEPERSHTTQSHTLFLPRLAS
jgi:hypothetical protein